MTALPLPPAPWRHAGRGEVLDATGLPVAWVCQSNDPAENEAVAELVARSPALLAAAVALARRLGRLAGTPDARHLPADLWVLSGELAGQAALAGGDITHPDGRIA